MDNNTKLENLEYYIKRGWPLIPVHWIRDDGTCSCGDPECIKSRGKHPIPTKWPDKASTDPQQIKAWHKQYPQANWGVLCGHNPPGAGLVVVDIDPRNGGDVTWENLRDEHPEPLETVQIYTGSGGMHLYFRYPDNGVEIGNPTDVWPGIDIKANKGMVLIPPSKTQERYTFMISPVEAPIDELPDWILSVIAPHKPPESIKIPQTGNSSEDLSDKTNLAIKALKALKKERADSYETWLEVGMALFELGDTGLDLWDGWSKQSEKYDPGACAQKWATLTLALTDASKISFGSLLFWAQEDGGEAYITPAPRKAKPSHYMKALTAFGYEFSANEMNDMLYANGTRLNDLLMAKIVTGLREYGYNSKEWAMDAIATMALEHQFHPIKDYLNSLEWEGFYDGETWHGADHIGQLALYFHDKDNIFPQLIRKWLIGAVERVMGKRPGQQHPMLVLDGPQGIGKSRFVWWLGSPLPHFYIQNSINTMDKDYLILLCSKWVWEVEELGATLRKSDIESLKAFLSKEIINVRKPYGRDEIVKPATASFIGTINSSGGFLADPTGNRRFRVCNLTGIDWDYDKQVNINQVWAQAVALHKAGETWEMDIKTQAIINDINTRYEVDDPLAYDLVDKLDIFPDQKSIYTSTAEIIHALRNCGAIVGGSDQQIAGRIANILQKMGCERDRVRINGHQVRAWLGVQIK